MFKKIPPIKLVEEILRDVGFSNGFQDNNAVAKLSIEKVDDWLPTIEPYYYPFYCKKFVLESKSNITILRQILRPHGYFLKTYEIWKYGSRKLYYKLHSNVMPQSFTVSFQ